MSSRAVKEKIRKSSDNILRRPLLRPFPQVPKKHVKFNRNQGRTDDLSSHVLDVTTFALKTLFPISHLHRHLFSIVSTPE